MTYRRNVLARLRFALSPRWVALHLLCLALIVTMVLLGRWQLDVSNSKHFNLQNFGYALQWWSFTAFVLVMWVRVLRDARQRKDEVPTGAPADAPTVTPTVGPINDPVAYRRYVMPSSADVAHPADAEHGAYNDYLARLADQDARDGAGGTSR